jgi:hypothetical protein
LGCISRLLLLLRWLDTSKGVESLLLGLSGMAVVLLSKVIRWQ